MYEGLEPTDLTKFDSFLATREPIQVIAQAYIFAQGVSAMAVSETGIFYL